MKIEEIKKAIYLHRHSKLKIVKIVNDIRGGGLKESKNIVDKYYNSDNLDNAYLARDIINHLRNSNEWDIVKRNIKKLNIL